MKFVVSYIVIAYSEVGLGWPHTTKSIAQIRAKAGRESMLQIKMRSLTAGLSLSLVMVMPAMAVAQSEGGGFLEEIVVTAQKREQNLQDVGISVNAYDARTIRDLALTNTEDIGNFTPNMSVRNTINGVMPIITIRGVGSGTNDAVFGTSPPSAAVHVDEVYYGSPGLLMFSQFDLERVEILKGPQGTLFGRNTTAGAVNYISAKPQSEFGAGVSLSFGQYSTNGTYNDIRAHVTGPLSDTLTARASYMGKFGESFVTNLEGQPYSGADLHALRVLFDWQASEDVSVLFNIHGGKDESAPVIGHKFLVRDAPGSTCNFEQNDHPVQDLVNCTTTAVPATTPIVSADGTTAVPFVQDRFPFNNDPYANDAAGPNILDNDISNVGFSARVDWDFDTMELVSITAYDDSDVLRNEYKVGYDVGTTRKYEERQRDEVEQFSQEVRLGHNADNLTWLVGGYYFTEEVIHTRKAHFRGETRLPEELRTDMFGDHDTDSWAAFADIEYRFSDDLALVAGLRYTAEEKSYNRLVSYNFQRNANFDVLDPSQTGTRLNPISGVPSQRWVRQEECPCTEDWDDINWKLGLNYQTSDEVLLYGLVSTGFKGGQYSGSSIINPNFLARPADPETVTAYEVGFKSEFGNNVRLNFAYFVYDYEDLQVITTVNDPLGNTSIIDNAEKMDIQGADLDLVWAPIDGLTITTAAGWVDGEYTKFSSTDPFSGVVRDFSGNDVVNTPTISITSGARYEWQVGDYEFSLAGDVVFTNYMDFDFQDEVATIGDFNRRAYGRDDLTIYNLRLNIETENGINVGIWGRNLGNEPVLNNVKFGLDEVFAEYGAPRSVGVTASINF